LPGVMGGACAGRRARAFGRGAARARLRAARPPAPRSRAPDRPSPPRPPAAPTVARRSAFPDGGDRRGPARDARPRAGRFHKGPATSGLRKRLEALRPGVHGAHEREALEPTGLLVGGHAGPGVLTAGALHPTVLQLLDRTI